MKGSEFLTVVAAILILTAVVAFKPILYQDFSVLPKYLLFSTIILAVSIGSKKLMASLLEAGVEHKIWTAQRFGYKPNYKLEREIPVGIIFPIFFSFFSLGIIRFLGILTYETKALKTRAAKRFGFYSFKEMTEWHNGLIGGVGIFACLLLSFVGYFPGLGELSRLSIFYAFSNMIPISNLDGTQILFGSKVLYFTLALITIIFLIYALLLI